MKKVKIYHNPRCSKSRQTLALINEHNIQPEITEYLKEKISNEELKQIINKLGISAHELIRKSEAEYKENFKGKTLSDEEWIQAMIDYPKLMERPIVVQGNKAIIGRPPEKVLDLF